MRQTTPAMRIFFGTSQPAKLGRGFVLFALAVAFGSSSCSEHHDTPPSACAKYDAYVGRWAFPGCSPGNGKYMDASVCMITRAGCSVEMDCASDTRWVDNLDGPNGWFGINEYACVASKDGMHFSTYYMGCDATLSSDGTTLQVCCMTETGCDVTAKRQPGV